METCTEPNCGKQFKSNSGLASHMYMIHKKTRTGESIPEKAVEQRITKLANSQADRFKQIREAKGKEKTPWQPTERGEAHYQKLAAKGIFRCPECAAQDHKSRDFESPKELGKHRRFKHGVLGRNTIQKMKRETMATAPEIVSENGVVQCPHCPKSGFKNLNGLAKHISKMHKDVRDPHPQSKELIHVNGSPQGTTFINGHGAATIHRPTAGEHDAAFITAIAVSNIGVQFEGLVSAASFEHDIPPRELARRCLLHLSKRYSQER